MRKPFNKEASIKVATKGMIKPNLDQLKKVPVYELDRAYCHFLTNPQHAFDYYSDLLESYGVSYTVDPYIAKGYGVNFRRMEHEKR